MPHRVTSGGRSRRVAHTPKNEASETKPKSTRVRQHRGGSTPADSVVRSGGKASTPVPTSGKGPADAEPTPASHPRLFTQDGIRRAHEPPKGVKLNRNSSGEGAYLEWYWQLDKDGKRVVDEHGNEVKGYVYSHDFVQQKALEKFAKNRDIGAHLASVREMLDADLAGNDKRSVLAAIVALIDHTYIRVGNETSATDRENFGATTLQRRHVEMIDGSRVVLAFRGKSYVDHRHDVRSWALAEKLQALVDACPAKDTQLFTWEGQSVTAAQVNRYLGNLSKRAGMQKSMTAKDFRSFHATRLARRFLLRCRNTPLVKRAEVVERMFAFVGQELGHRQGTGTAKKHYVDPLVPFQFLQGTLRGKLEATRGGGRV